MQQLVSLTYEHPHIVRGRTTRKDWLEIMQLLPQEATYYFCQASVPRPVEVYQLSQRAATLGLKGIAIRAVKAAYRQAQSQATQADVIFMGGSTYGVAGVGLIA